MFGILRSFGEGIFRFLYVVEDIFGKANFDAPYGIQVSGLMLRALRFRI